MSTRRTMRTLIGGVCLLAAPLAGAYSPADWNQYGSSAPETRQFGPTQATQLFRLTAATPAAQWQEMHVYRTYRWQPERLKPQAERKCGDEQTRIEDGWRVKVQQCELNLKAGTLIRVESQDFGYGLSSSGWSALPNTPTGWRRDRLALPRALTLGQEEVELDRCQLDAQGRCPADEWHYDPKQWEQLQVMEETPSERDGRLDHVFYRLAPKEQSAAASAVRELHVWRQHQWQPDPAQAIQECAEPRTREEMGNTITFRTCRQLLPIGSRVTVTLHDTGYMMPAEQNEWQPLPQTDSWQEVKTLNQPLVLATTEEQLDCRKANGRPCAEPTEPDLDLLDAEAAQLVADVSGADKPAWEAGYGHDDAKLMAAVRGMQALLDANQPTHPAMDKLLYYVRAHNYFGGVTKESDESAKALARVMIALLNHPALLGSEPQDQAGTVLEAWSVAAQGQLEQSAFRQAATPMLAQLVKALDYAVQHAATINGHKPWADGLFELLNLVDYASYQSRDADFGPVLVGQERALRRAMLALGESELALWKSHNGQADLFVFNNILDAYTRLYRMMQDQDASGSEAYRDGLDRDVIALLNRHGLVPGGAQSARLLEEVSLTLSTYYLRHTDRSAAACSEGPLAGYCTPIRVEEILPFSHTCSPTLSLRAQDLDQTQAEQICRKLGDEEQRFHRVMETGWQPVADDNNRSLELVIFDSSDDWNRYGGALFDGVSTDNGGIYIEGEPARQDNQARFFAYEAQWKRPAFQVWNLRHEYVHYLDGRFNQYGSFGHYPLNRSTWWAEGLAEYIAHGQCFARGLNAVAQSQAGQRPSLQSILHLDYESGSEMVYSWSYTVHRFLNETGRRDSWLAMAQALRQADRSKAMADYERVMNQLIANDSQAYRDWIDGQLIPWWEANRNSPECQSNDSAH
ncbi:collagenase [Aeromonas diversa]|uniref:collagenase n=1 Tax=Aeromonas diversa TaxID=502790 RepID=UPI0039A064B4